MSTNRVTANNFVELLHAAVPEADSVVTEHFDDNEGELLLHLLMADLLRLAVGAFGSGDTALSSKLLTFIGLAFENADEGVENAIAVSFVEHVGAGIGETPEFIASWPESLLRERDRQLSWYVKRVPGLHES